MNERVSRDNPLGKKYRDSKWRTYGTRTKQVRPGFPVYEYFCPNCRSDMWIGQDQMNVGFLNWKIDCPYCEKSWYATGKGDKLFISPNKVKDPELLYEYRCGKPKPLTRIPQVKRSPCE
jgi:Zn-finger nucleic acid-binding protein